MSALKQLIDTVKSDKDLIKRVRTLYSKQPRYSSKPNIQKSLLEKLFIDLIIKIVNSWDGEVVIHFKDSVDLTSKVQSDYLEVNLEENYQQFKFSKVRLQLLKVDGNLYYHLGVFTPLGTYTENYKTTDIIDISVVVGPNTIVSTDEIVGRIIYLET